MSTGIICHSQSCDGLGLADKSGMVRSMVQVVQELAKSAQQGPDNPVESAVAEVAVKSEIAATASGLFHVGADLHDPGKVPQVEGVVGLARGGQQLGHGLAVYIQCSCNDVRPQLFAALRKATTLQMPAQYGLENGHQGLICDLQSSAAKSLGMLCCNATSTRSLRWSKLTLSL